MSIAASCAGHGGGPACDVVEITAVHHAIWRADQRLRETLRNQSIRDSLTGLFNRRYTEETLNRELHRADRQGGMLAILAMDVDHFKRFSDSFGHEAGDKVLRAIASYLLENTRRSDVVSRIEDRT
jgi:GGDEF domain-containing protein